MQDALLGNSNLRAARLYDTNPMGADLGGVDLRDSHLIRADLSKANLRGADLRGTQLDGEKLFQAIANSPTCWPSGFDATTAEAIFDA